jgi:hypothetical protein
VLLGPSRDREGRGHRPHRAQLHGVQQGVDDGRRELIVLSERVARGDYRRFTLAIGHRDSTGEAVQDVPRQSTTTGTDLKVADETTPRRRQRWQVRPASARVATGAREEAGRARGAPVVVTGLSATNASMTARALGHQTQ